MIHSQRFLGTLLQQAIKILIIHTLGVPLGLCWAAGVSSRCFFLVINHLSCVKDKGAGCKATAQIVRSNSPSWLGNPGVLALT